MLSGNFLESISVFRRIFSSALLLLTEDRELTGKEQENPREDREQLQKTQAPTYTFRNRVLISIFFIHIHAHIVQFLLSLTAIYNVCRHEYLTHGVKYD